ncbi:hypothetical protein N9R43_01045 [bacterium]|nr:hypothetical protein [bacterium]
MADTNYNKPFTDLFKLYLFKHRERCKLTVMVTETFGITYLWDQEQFESMCNGWQEEWAGKAKGAEIFVGPKKGENKERFVRFSSSAQFGTEHRFSYAEMNELTRQYWYQKENKMPWDK